MNVYTTDLLYS